MTEERSWVRRLAPAGPIDSLTPTCLPATWNQAVAVLGINPSLWVVEFARDLALLQLDPGIPAVRRAAATELARPATEAVVLNALMALEQHLAAPVEVPPEAIRQFAGIVRRRGSLELILTHERASHARVGEVLLAQLQRLVPPEEQASKIAELSQFLVDFVTGFTLATAAALIAEEQAWLASVDGSRAELVRALLKGENADSGLATRLKYDLANRTHVGLIIRRDTGPEDERTDSLERTAANTFTRLGAISHLIIASGTDEVWAWGAFLSPENIDLSLAYTDAADVRLAAGRPHEGTSGFRRTHEEAQTAALLASFRRLDDPRGRAMLFRDVRLVAMIASNIEAARVFTRDELGALASDREAALRETVRVYLECNCSPAGAAARLNVVKNTVVYRVRRAEELLGRSVKQEQGVLWAALHVAEAIGIEDSPASAS